MVLPVLSRAFAGASAGAGLSLLKQIGAGDRPGHHRNFPNAFLLAHKLPTVATRAPAPDPDLEAGQVLLISARDRGAAFVQSFCWEATAQQHSRIYLACLNNWAQSRHRHAMVEAGDLLSLK